MRHRVRLVTAGVAGLAGVASVAVTVVLAGNAAAKDHTTVSSDAATRSGDRAAVDRSIRRGYGESCYS